MSENVLWELVALWWSHPIPEATAECINGTTNANSAVCTACVVVLYHKVCVMCMVCIR